MSYHLDYVEKPEQFDEVIVQDGVKVLVDSKALFSIIGSEMDWAEDRLRYIIFESLLRIIYTKFSPPFRYVISSKFLFKNPNVQGTCGCGESFSLAPR